MSREYKAVDATTMQVIENILDKHHKPLAEAKIKIDAQFWVGNDSEPSIKVAGYPIFGRVKIFTPDLRKGGSKDMRLCIDFTEWEQSSEDEREAMIDHLLQQYEIVTKEKDGSTVYDDAGRPKLKRRKYDLRLAGFSEVAARHGRNSVEHRTVATMKVNFNQLYLFQNDDPAVTKMVTPAAGNGAAEVIGKPKRAKKLPVDEHGGLRTAQ